MKRARIAAAVVACILLTVTGCKEWDAPQAASAASGLKAELIAAQECEALVNAKDGVSGRENYLYNQCRFDRLEQLLGLSDDSPSPSATPSSTPTATATATPTATPTQTPTVSPSDSQTPTATATPTTGAALLDLPRVPWHGGNAYYRQFSKATNFSRADYFPIGIFYGNSETQDQANWDQDHGITWHVEGNQRDFTGDYSEEICFTEDELNGRNENQAQVESTLRSEINSCAAAGRIPYTNGTDQLVSDYGTSNNAYFKRLINLGGAQSIDEYYYALAKTPCYASNRAYVIGASDAAHCSSSASYGNVIRQLRARDDAPLQPLFGFVENGAPIYNSDSYITPTQLDGAVWSSITNGAGGIIYFNNSFGGACQSSQVLRDAQYGKAAGGRSCYGAIAEQMKATNAAVQALAPVLNTQSYAWDFGAAKTDTMLKAKDGYAYVFASVGINGDPGTRTFTLPAGLTGNAEVVGENRTVTVAGGKMVDSFAAESDHNVYRIKIA